MAEKPNLKLVGDEAERLRKEFAQVFDRANTLKAKPADVARLRELLGRHDDLKLWGPVQSVMQAAEAALLVYPSITPGVALCWRERQVAMRGDLGWAEATPAERLLIRHVTICYLRLGLVELEHTQHTKGSHTLTAGVYWDRRLTAAQRNFTRSLESLARQRKLQAEAERARGGRGALPEARTGTAG